MGEFTAAQYAAQEAAIYAEEDAERAEEWEAAEDEREAANDVATDEDEAFSLLAIAGDMVSGPNSVGPRT